MRKYDDTIDDNSTYAFTTYGTYTKILNIENIAMVNETIHEWILLSYFFKMLSKKTT